MRTQINIRYLISKVLLIVFMVLISSSCIKTFDYSIYSAYVPVEYRNTRESNFNKLKETNLNDTINTKTLNVALISDPHYSYNNLEDAVYSINEHEEIDIIIAGGDLSDGGILEEFLLFKYVMEQATVPYFTVIGNHDCLANGYPIYQELFGPDNYTLRIANCKFVFFNDIVWELNVTEPDFFWLKSQIFDKGNAEHLFVVTHIPPYSDSFSPLQQLAYVTMVDSAKVDLSISGHLHHHYYGDYYGNGNKYMTIGAVSKRHWVKLNIDEDSINVERIEF